MRLLDRRDWRGAGTSGCARQGRAGPPARAVPECRGGTARRCRVLVVVASVAAVWVPGRWRARARRAPGLSQLPGRRSPPPPAGSDTACGLLHPPWLPGGGAEEALMNGTARDTIRHPVLRGG